LGPINPNTLFASLQGKRGENFKEKINKIEGASGKNKGIRKESYYLNWLMCVARDTITYHSILESLV
jgi:hypothetical protein